MGNSLQTDIIDQFSDRGQHADIWRGFNVLFPTNTFLNLGYSRWYQPVFVGSSQQRLAAKIGTDLERHFSRTTGLSLLDIGCGRGGPAIHLTEEHGFAVTGIDLVPFNIETAVGNADNHGLNIDFVLGSAESLPFSSESFPVCTAFDSIVYIPDKPQLFREIKSVMHSDGLLAIADLVTASDVDQTARTRVREFGTAWDMPPLKTAAAYQQTIEEAGFIIDEFHDISQNSTARFRKWTALYLFLIKHSGSDWVNRFFSWRGINLDIDEVTDQIQRAHDALPYLRHILIYAHP